ncbi:MAG: PASTA domain-containing protein [Candidatus Hodarchaeota archaeon]
MPEEIERLKRELEEAKETIRIKDHRITDLSKEIQDLRGKLDTLQRERPKLAPENLIDSFGIALVKMQEGLKVGEGRVDYMISKFDIDLKAAVTLDEQGSINFQLPKLEDIIPFENLSTLHLSMKPVPRPSAPPPETAEVPSLIGMSKDAALESIKTAKFKVGTIKERTSVTAPGTVIEQSPDRYSRVKIGSPIDLIISKVREAKVPNVIGMDKDDAIEVIRSARLAVGKITEQVSDSPPGTVISQSIAADTLVPVETSIDLLIAKPEMVTVPDVVGKGIKDARKTIEKAKLKVGEIAEKPSAEPKDTVIEQSPEAGKEVPVETLINLVAAKPEMMKVPNVIGMKREEAVEIIERTKLKVGRILEKESEEPPDIVIEQKPEAGVKVAVDTAIDITLSKPEMVVVPNLIGLRREEAERVASETHLKIGKIIVRKSKKPKDTIIGQKPNQGTKVPGGASIGLTISKGMTPPTIAR